MSLVKLQQKIDNQTAKLCVIGLGYVGLPVASLFAKAGFQVIGLDIKADRIEKINRGISPIDGLEPGLSEIVKEVVESGHLKGTTDYADIEDCDIILIDVETPVDENHVPRYVAMKGALASLGPVLKDQALVIVESTIAPGTIATLVQPMLEEATGKKVNEGFYLGHCPERVMPGKLLANLRGVSRVCGGSTPETAEIMIALYRYVVAADLDPADCVTAELVKTTENAYRDVNIAFANQVALICEAVGGDVWKVRELVNKSPGRNMLYPGAGVGGHCIPKDPWLLAYQAKTKGTAIPLIEAARTINESMPLHMVDLLEDALKEVGKDLKDSRILVLGYTYLENSDDVRHSPSQALVEKLENLGTTVVIHDPYIDTYQGDVYEMAQQCDGAVIMVKHDTYAKTNWNTIKTHLNYPIVVDGRRIITDASQELPGFVFRGVGKPTQT